MKRKILTKLTAVLLVLTVVLAYPVSAAALTVASYGAAIVYVPDMNDIPLYERKDDSGMKIGSDTLVFGIKSEKFKDSVSDIIGGLTSAVADSDKGATKIATAINRMFSDIGMNQYGVSKNSKVKPITYESAMAYNINTEAYTANIKALAEKSGGAASAKDIYVFNYDWRLDPVANAGDLREFIDLVTSKPDIERVALISGGTGGNVVNSYLYTYREHAKENLLSCIFLDSTATGNSFVGAVMSGDVVSGKKKVNKDEDDDIFSAVKDVYESITGDDVGNAIARYIEQDPGGIVTSMISRYIGEKNYAELWATIGLVIFSKIMADQNLFRKVGSGYKKIISASSGILYDEALRDNMKYVPGFWALVPEEDYEDAVELMFGSESEMTTELRNKIYAYRDVLAATEDTLMNAQADGINTCVVAGYGMQMLPITGRIDEQSDGFTATRYAGMGVRTGDIDGKISVAQKCTNGNHNHMEPQKCCDAATCYLPDQTWFICNHKNMDYGSETAAKFILWLALSKNQRSVIQNEMYPQYLRKAVIGDKIFAYSTLEDAELNDYYYGDLDVDGSISVADARIALRYAVGLEGEPSRILTKVGDVGGDGKIGVDDARYILRYAVGLDDTFPVVSRKK